MRVYLFLLTMFLGAVLAIHLAMNGKVGDAIGNVRVANAVFWVIGAVGAVLIGLSGWHSGALAPLRQINPLLLTAGLIGAALVFGTAWTIPQMGAGPAMVALLAGEVLGGLVLSHFGWLGSPVDPINLVKVIGVIIMIGGASIVTFVK